MFLSWNEIFDSILLANLVDEAIVRTEIHESSVGFGGVLTRVLELFNNPFKMARFARFLLL